MRDPADMTDAENDHWEAKVHTKEAAARHEWWQRVYLAALAGGRSMQMAKAMADGSAEAWR